MPERTLEISFDFPVDLSRFEIDELLDDAFSFEISNDLLNSFPSLDLVVCVFGISSRPEDLSLAVEEFRRDVFERESDFDGITESSSTLSIKLFS